MHRILRKQLDREKKEASIVSRREDREICGLIVDNGYFLELVRLKNKTRRIGGFSFYKNEVKEIEKAVQKIGNKIVGTFHSHIISAPEPGRGDIEGAEEGALMLIIDAEEETSMLWRIRRGKAQRLNFRQI